MVKLSTALDHIHMVNCGFTHAELNAMSEEEFCFWRDQRAEYDRIVKEAADEQTKGSQ